MDGTLADTTDYQHFVSGDTRDFHAFHSASVDMPPVTDVVKLAQSVHDAGHAVVVVTSRASRYRGQTAWWLAEHQVPSDALYMRADGDGRPDIAVKRDLLTRLRLRFRPIHAVDDNPSVLRLWTEEGIETTQIPSAIAGDVRYQ